MGSLEIHWHEDEWAAAEEHSDTLSHVVRKTK